MAHGDARHLVPGRKAPVRGAGDDQRRWRRQGGGRGVQPNLHRPEALRLPGRLKALPDALTASGWLTAPIPCHGSKFIRGQKADLSIVMLVWSR